MISFKSNVTKKLLNYFFINPQESLYVNELSRTLSLDKRNLVKKLKELETEGVLKSEARGNLKIYSINDKYPLVNELKKIFFKTAGIEFQLKKIFKDISGVKNCYLYGSYAENKMDAHSDIDLLVVGDHKILDLQRKISKLQKDIGREINIVNMELQEYENRIKENDPFLSDIMKKAYTKVY